MKKITVLLMVMLLCISAIGVVAFAADAGAITVSSATAARGEEVTVTASLQNNPGVALIAVTLKYDADCLELVSYSGSVDGVAMATVLKTGKASWVGTGDSVYNGQFLTATFKVKDSAAIGDTSVTVTMDEAYNWDEEDVSFTAGTGKVTVTVPAHTHTYGDWTVTKEATCTEAGSKTRTCTVADCGATETETIAVVAHSYSASVTAPTCTAEGYTTYTCSVCGDSYTADKTAVLAHNYGEWTETKAPTCTEKGTKIRTCTVCNNATETSDVPALGHTPSADSVIEKAPTCEEEGLATGSCSVCGEKLTNEVIAALGHSYDDVVVTAPTCTEDGYTTYTCSVCENSYIGDETDALGHDYVVTETVDPTCEDDGHETSVCSRCEDTTTKTLPATGHTYESFEQTETGHIGTCACGDVAEEEAHEYSINGDVLVKPTTTTEGQQEMLCVCGAKTVVTLDKLTAELDDVPKTGDITGELAMGAMVIVAMFAAVAFVFKRKAAK